MAGQSLRALDSLYLQEMAEQGSDSSPPLWTLSLSRHIKAPVQDVWDLVGDFIQLGRWVPIASSTLSSGEPQSVGAVRYVVAEHGAYFYERLVELDLDNHAYAYVLEDNSLGLKDYTGSLRLTDGPDTGTTVISWGYTTKGSSDPGVTQESVEASLSAVFHKSVDGMEQKLFSAKQDGARLGEATSTGAETSSQIEVDSGSS